MKQSSIYKAFSIIQILLLLCALGIMACAWYDHHCLGITEYTYAPGRRMWSP